MGDYSHRREAWANAAPRAHTMAAATIQWMIRIAITVVVRIFGATLCPLFPGIVSVFHRHRTAPRLIKSIAP